MENNENKNKIGFDSNVKDKNSGSLSDERRVKVMSPSMLVFKRFIRNKLAVVGFCILAVMFTFAFIGPIFSPYTEIQQFQTTKTLVKEYAEYQENTSWRSSTADDTKYKSLILIAQKHTSQKEETFEYESMLYRLNYVSEEYITLQAPVGVARCVDGTVTPIAGSPVTVNDEFSALVNKAIEDETLKFVYPVEGGVEYTLVYERDPDRVSTIYNVCAYDDVAMLTKMVFHVAKEGADEELVKTYEFQHAAMEAYANRETSFKVGAKTYTYGVLTVDGFRDISLNGEIFGKVTTYLLQGANYRFLDLQYKQLVFNAVKLGKKTFEAEYEVSAEDLDADAEGTAAPENTEEPEATAEPEFTKQMATFLIERKDFKYTVSVDTVVPVKDDFSAPSAQHMLGTEQYGMDVVTRLMYGGRVSLTIGFVVMIIEIVIGVILGGLSGYFSGWVDVVIMRIIELVNCIPFYPMLMIIGSLMDSYKVDNTARIFLLMVILGILSWTGVARIVRGQILSLREQDFMVATEACGIPVSRRIFRHLVPNVIPLLIVQATMGLGGLIITEATLGFLGLGVKYPNASWGSIIYQASTAHVMRNFWWVWIPAGVLILLTVLGFNFVGDGLRDAFDPKMKR